MSEKVKKVIDGIRAVLSFLNGLEEPKPLEVGESLTPEETFPFRAELVEILCEILTHELVYEGLYLLLELNILDYILPEIKAMNGVEQPPEFHPEGDVFRHTALTVHFLENPDCKVAFAALLHDVGKPVTFRIKERIRFDGHNTAAVPLIKRIAARLHLDSETTRLCIYVASEHMRLLDAKKMRSGRLLNLIKNPLFKELLVIWRADILASHGDLDDYLFILNKYQEYCNSQYSPPPLISGNDIILLGYSPGPIFKEILDAVKKAQEKGEVFTRGEALEFISKNFGTRKK